VRFLGAMQVVLGLAIGAGALGLAKQLWDAPEGSAFHRPIRALLSAVTPGEATSVGARRPAAIRRTGPASPRFAAALVVLVTLPGARALSSRVRVLPDFEGSHCNELHDIAQRLQREPPGPQAGRHRRREPLVEPPHLRIRPPALAPDDGRWADCRRARTTTFCGR